MLLFCYILIDEIKALNDEIIEPKPIGYFQYNIPLFVMLFNITSGVCKIIGSILILVFRKINLKIEKRLLNEKEENLIDNIQELKLNSMTCSVIKDIETIATTTNSGRISKEEYSNLIFNDQINDKEIKVKYKFIL